MVLLSFRTSSFCLSLLCNPLACAGMQIPPSQLPPGWKWLYSIDGVAQYLRLASMAQFDCSGAPCPSFYANDVGIPFVTNPYTYISGRLETDVASRWNGAGYLVLITAIIGCVMMTGSPCAALGQCQGVVMMQASSKGRHTFRHHDDPFLPESLRSSCLCRLVAIFMFRKVNHQVR